MTTPDPSVLLDLAERCERATGPDRELDCLIFESQHLLLMPVHRGTIDHEPTGEYFDQDGNQLPERAPHYTGSIDAAMMLVPEGFWTTLRVCKNKDSERAYCHAILECDADTMERDLPDDFDFTYEAKNCISGALALCAAALRARSTDPVRK